MNLKIFFIEALMGSIFMALVMIVASFILNPSIYYIPLILGFMLLYYILIGLPSLCVWYFLYKKLVRNKKESYKALFNSGVIALLSLASIVALAEWSLSFIISFSKYGAGPVPQFFLIATPGFLVSWLFIGLRLNKH